MSKQEKELLPRLRFQEFEKHGPWDVEPLEDIADKVRDKNKSGLIKTVFTNSAQDGIVNQRDYFDKDIANKRNLANYYIVKDGDYVYNPRISSEAPVGPLSRNNLGKTGVMSPLYTVFRFRKKENSFYEYYFNTQYWYKSIRKKANTGARFDRISITDSEFMNIEVLAPKHPEQQKIAVCLSSLDELIAAEQDKLAALQSHKKGLLQNLFPKEGEKVPAYRFPKFRGDGEWVDIKLGELCTKISSGKDKKASSGAFKLYGSTGQIGTTNNASYHGRYILIARVGANAGLTNIIEGDFGVTDNTLVVDLDKGACLDFVYNYLVGYNLNSIVFGSGQPLITGKQLKVLTIRIPRVNEQEKIANVLSSMDELISSQISKIDDLEKHKKGLLQGLFPKN